MLVMESQLIIFQFKVLRNSFSSSLWGDASSNYLSTLLVFFFKPPWVELWLILDRSKSLTECSNLWWFLVMWDFIYISFDLSLVMNIISFSICGIMEVLIDNLRLQNISKKKHINGQKSKVGDHPRKDPMLIQSRLIRSLVQMWSLLVLRILLQTHMGPSGSKGMIIPTTNVLIHIALQFFSVLNGLKIRIF
jgi:hypothetical protein